MTKQLNKLIEVLKIVELEPSAVHRELILIKVGADLDHRGRVLEILQLFQGAKAVDISPETITIEAVGSPDKLAALMQLLEPFGIRELVQSGVVAMGRGPRSITDRERPFRAAQVDPPRPLTPPASSRPHPVRTTRRDLPVPATMFYDTDADLSLIQSRNVAVLGFGSQGHAHALSLRDSGVDVRVGLPEGSKSRAKAEAQGLRVLTPYEACEEADLIMVLTPDPSQRKLYAEAIEPNLVPGDALFFSHGFNIRYGYITPPEGVDVAMVAPKGPGHLVRREYSEGRGVPVLVAVEQDATGKAWDLALAYAKGDRRPARRRHQDHLHRGDRDRPVR